MKAKKQFMIIIEGPMGSGKSTIGALVHKKLKRTAILSTDMIKRFVSDFKRSKRDNQIAAAVLRAMCEEYFKLGLNVVVAQGFWREEYYKTFTSLAKKHKVKIYAYQLEASRAVLLKRIATRPIPPGAKFLPQSRILKNLRTWQNNRFDAGVTIDTSTLSAEQVATQILKDVK